MSTKSAGKRRDVLRGAAALLAGIVTARPARSQPVNDDYDQPKLDRAFVKYRDAPGPDGHACGNCTNYVSPGHCRVVEGEVSLNGYCLSYAPKDIDF